MLAILPRYARSRLLPLIPLVAAVVFAALLPARPAIAAAEPFGSTTVIEIARELAKKPYVAPDQTLPASIDNLAYDDYQSIKFNRTKAIGRDRQLPIWVELFHRGLLYRERIDVALVKNGFAENIPYSTDLYDFTGLRSARREDGDIGFAGLRLLGPLNSDDFEEFAVFQGASYFRAIGQGEGYGLSARGLALKTDRPGSEEFPVFRKFWIEEPAAGGDSSVVVHALLDSPSVAGAYRFVVKPGMPTTMEVSATLFPRVDLDDVGIGPGTSMFAFSAMDRKNADDYRPEVHDSEGLLIREADGSYFWRPLNNPPAFTTTRYDADSPTGFGLMQRTRDFNSYQDLWARYETRPSLWVEPQGDWGKGKVTLVEIPTVSEFFDNIVAYWQPAEPLRAGSQHTFAYKLSWGAEPRDRAAVTVAASRSGQVLSDKPIPLRQFMVDFADAAALAMPSKAPFAAVRPSVEVGTTAGFIGGPLITDMPGVGWRIGFQLDPKGATSADIRMKMTFPDGRPTEGWVYHWTRE